MKVKKSLIIWALILGLSCGSFFLPAVELQQNQQNRVTIFPDETANPVKIDGDLNEEIWKLPPVEKQFKTTSPNIGDTFPVLTKIWAAYDKENLYFAFLCLEPDSNKIKTSIAQRDNILRDDHVGIMLDSTGNNQSNYEFYVNPNGIQADAVDSSTRLTGSDFSPDFVWESAGKITDQGYQVEICIPLKSIRFKEGQITRMGIIFARQVSHLGISGVWPEVKSGQSLYNFMAYIEYKGLAGNKKIEILPNFTYSTHQNRLNDDSWGKETDKNLGLGVKYGITSSITAEATLNPDFSQVESDTFQMEINQRYPIFFNEKRPFFMESMEILDFGVVKFGMMKTPIHTRRIMDPGWAVKLSGSLKKLDFALLGANDRIEEVPGAAGTGQNEKKNPVWGIMRAKYNIGSGNYLGVLYSGRYEGDAVNNTIGTDLRYSLSKHIRTTLSYLYTATRENKAVPFRKGNGINAMFQYNTENYFALAGYERYDSDFHMASAFINRVGFDRWLLGTGPVINMKLKKLPWLKQIITYGYYIRLNDLQTHLSDQTKLAGILFSFAPMGSFNAEYYIDDEGWSGKVYRKHFIFTFWEIQLFKWLHLFSNMTIGDGLYYDPVNPFVGKTRDYSIGTTFQPGTKINIGLDYYHSALLQPITNDKVYSVDIYNFRTTYQLNKYFFIRGIVRYDNYREKLLTDLLASFTLIPGTVVHLGYGSLYSRGLQETETYNRAENNPLREIRRGLFFKASYLWRPVFHRQ